jgi:subtilase family serine protease
VALAGAGMLTAACGTGPTATASTTPTTSTAGHAGPVAAVSGPTCPYPRFVIPPSQPLCYPPQVLRTAYGIQPLLDRGIDGRGVTVVLPEEAETGPSQPPAVTDIRQDMADYDHRFALPPAKIQVITTLAGESPSPWLANGEEAGDTEMVHAIAPGATIVELPVDTAALRTAAGWVRMVRTAAGHGNVISFSLGVAEDLLTSTEVTAIHSALEYAAARHVTVIAASGDWGAAGQPGSAVFGPGSSTLVKEVSLPASDPLVLGVGGTTLTANPVTGAYVSETAWNSCPCTPVPAASGGGFSQLFARPAYQHGVPGTGATRGVPDVAASAWFDIALSVPCGGYELIQPSGTSAGAPFWAGLIALADQQAGHPLGFVNPAIYRIARGPQYHTAFHDTTTGNNTVIITSPPATITGYPAGPGWDPVTGWGTPDAQVLIPLLAR